MKRFSIAFFAAAIVLGSGFLLLTGNGQAPKNDPVPPPQPSYVIPFEVPAKGSLPSREPQFYWFSWAEFFALNWPAKVPAGQPSSRGVPDTDKTIGDPGPRVWETWKSDFELFPAQPGYPDKIIQPTAWDSWDQPEPVCGNEHPSAGAKVLPLVAKGESVIPGGVNQAMGAPLVDQHLQYVRYEIRVNKTEYNETKDKQWFLRKNLKTFKADSNERNEFSASKSPNYGAIEIKAAWRILTDAEAKAKPARFHMSKAWVVDPKKPGHCSQVTVGLVGLHIAHKTEQFPAWVWATFEQVDNVPGNGVAPPLGYSFNNPKQPQPAQWGFCVVRNGKCDPEDEHKDYAPVAAQDLPVPPHSPVQTVRVNPIPKDAAAMNQSVHQLKGIKGTVWEYYELVAGQWQDAFPKTIQVSNPATSDDLYSQLDGFPKDAIANVTMETFFQGKTPGNADNLIGLSNFGTSCLHCHYQASQYDFSWVLADAAWPSNPAAQGQFQPPKAKSGNEPKPK